MSLKPFIVITDINDSRYAIRPDNVIEVYEPTEESMEDYKVRLTFEDETELETNMTFDDVLNLLNEAG